MLILRHQDRRAGFTLIEVLITLVILAVGLLGLAKMQMSGIRYTQDSYLRSQGIAMAYDMVDRIRANPDGLEDGNYTNPDTTSADCMVNECTAAQLAYYDVNEWQTAIQSSLPGGTGTIAQVGTSDIYNIVVDWTDTRMDESDDTSSRFQLNFRAE